MIFFIRLSHLVTVNNNINKNLPSSRFLFILLQIKKIIYFHYQCSLPNPTPSASSLKFNFQISDTLPPKEHKTTFECRKQLFILRQSKIAPGTQKLIYNFGISPIRFYQKLLKDYQYTPETYLKSNDLLILITLYEISRTKSFKPQ